MDEDEEAGGEPTSVMGGSDSVVPNDGPFAGNNGNPGLSRIQKIVIVIILLVPAVTLHALAKKKEKDKNLTQEKVKNLAREEYKSLALSLSKNETLLDDASSPQSKAVEWLVEEELEHQSGWDDTELMQRYVLAVLYHSTGGGRWRNNARRSWFQSLSVCQWSSHFTCNVSGDIDSISLGEDNLQGTIPIELGQLTSMTRLDLPYNALTGPIPSELGQLTAMTWLELYSNVLTGPIPSELGRLRAMTELNLGQTNLTGPIPSELGQLTAIRSLVLAGNALTGPIPSKLGQLTAMKELWLYGNAFTGPVPSELGHLTAMKELWLYDNAFTGTVPNELTKLTNLDIIHLHSNDLTGTVPSTFCVDPFPDWRSDYHIFATDCISQVQCDCCNICYDEAGNCFEWSNSEGDFVSSTAWQCS